MTGRDLFILHPVAWTHAHQVLEAEAAMVGTGQNAEVRAEFLRTNLSLLYKQAEVMINEVWTDLFADMNRSDFVLGVDVMRARLDAHGFSGTLRQIRALERMSGQTDAGIDQLLFMGGVVMLQNNDLFGELARGAFGEQLEVLIKHPEVKAAESEHQRIMTARNLPSEKESQNMELARNVLMKIGVSNPDVFDCDERQIRAYAGMRGMILDLRITDILLALLERGAVMEVRQALQSSLGRSAEHYRLVVQQIITGRLDEIEKHDDADRQTTRNAESLPNATEAVHAGADVQPEMLHNTGTEAEQKRNNTGTDAAQERHRSGVLTTEEVLKLLKISRTTLYTLAKQGVLVPIKVGRANRYSRTDIDRFLGTSTAD